MTIVGGQLTREKHMKTDWLDHYIYAWLLHPVAGTPDGAMELRELLAFVSPSIRYEDVPTASVFEGHEGMKAMCELAHQWSPDLTVHVLSRQTDGKMFAFEAESTGTNATAMGDLPATGRKFVLRGVSVGSFDDDGLVVSQRDYWDLGSFLSQVGLLPGS